MQGAAQGEPGNSSVGCEGPRLVVCGVEGAGGVLGGCLERGA